MKSNKLKVALPAGSLKNATIELLRKSGFKITVSERSYFPTMDDAELECMFIRAQEIPKYVSSGKFDVGITGKDWIEETGVNVNEISELNYSKNGLNPIKLVIAVPNSSTIKTIYDLKDKTIATELVNVTKKFLTTNGISANVEYSWGATEVKTPYLVDAIAELTDSGESLRANNLRVVSEIMQSKTMIIANTDSVKDSWKKTKINTIALLLNSVLDAEGMVGIKLNIPNKLLKKITAIIPSLRKPTVSKLLGNKWSAVEFVVLKSVVRNIIPKLKEIGAEGIVEYPLNKIIY